MTEAASTTRRQADLRRWRQYLANERAEGAVYAKLAEHRSGEERAILRGLAEAERRHEAHWLGLLGADVGAPRQADLRTRILVFLATHFGSVFVLALAQRAEARSPYADEPTATAAMAADERIHGEVVRGLAARERSRLAGTFRAAVFGANDGLVSNLALVLGVAGAGATNQIVLLTGIAGLLAGALSMGAGEFVSVRSQRELLESSEPDPAVGAVLRDLDIDANELALVYRARGMSEADAVAQAERLLSGFHALGTEHWTRTLGELPDHQAVGSALGAGVASFVFFASGALIPILPFVVGLTGTPALVASVVLVGAALLVTGGLVGLLSGASPLLRGLRQLAIGWGAAAVTYLVGRLFGATIA